MAFFLIDCYCSSEALEDSSGLLNEKETLNVRDVNTSDAVNAANAVEKYEKAEGGEDVWTEVEAHGDALMRDAAMARELLAAVRQGIDKLRQWGYSESDWDDWNGKNGKNGKNDKNDNDWAGRNDRNGTEGTKCRESARNQPAPDRLRISRSYRISLPDRGGKELLLPPLLKTVFILFLKHPEGIEFKQLSSYSAELEQIYTTISHRSDVEAMKNTIRALVEPFGSSIHISRSRLAKCLEKRLGKEGARAYGIIGPNGQKKVIDIDRTMLEWE